MPLGAINLRVASPSPDCIYRSFNVFEINVNYLENVHLMLLQSSAVFPMERNPEKSRNLEKEIQPSQESSRTRVHPMTYSK